MEISATRFIKACKLCEKPIHNAKSNQQYCPECARIKKRMYDKKRRSKNPEKCKIEEFVPPLTHKKYTGPSLDEIMRKANEEGLQYAAYCKKYGLK